jgi:hypothetical protein
MISQWCAVPALVSIVAEVRRPVWPALAVECLDTLRTKVLVRQSEGRQAEVRRLAAAALNARD